MKTICKRNKCNGCMACISICPKKCIQIKDTVDAINAVVDESVCINCKLCERVCPNISHVNKNKLIEWKQGWSITNIRNLSTSGGIASEVIYRFILSGGYVASCFFKDGEFLFDITNNINDAMKFAGSKYVKSNPQGIYEKIKEKLITHKVLFIGLPCQVAALNNYVKVKENLYTIDLICHGTPSNKLLKKYLYELNYDVKKIRNIKFRDKLDFGLFINNIKINPPRVMDHYICSFLEGVNYTENCYQCEFASIDRVSDITLGDSWGTSYKDQEKNGISLVLVQSEKGKELLQYSDIELLDVDLKNAIKYNEQLVQPTKLSKKREKFFKLINNGTSYKKSTLIVLPKLVIKQYLKYVLALFHII